MLRQAVAEEERRDVAPTEEAFGQARAEGQASATRRVEQADDRIPAGTGGGRRVPSLSRLEFAWAPQEIASNQGGQTMSDRLNLLYQAQYVGSGGNPCLPAGRR